MHAANHLRVIIEQLGEALQTDIPRQKRQRLDAALQWAWQQYDEERRDQLESEREARLEHFPGVDAPHGYQYGD